MDNMKLWNAVCKTDPRYTRKANVKGNKITSIAPQYQIKMATEAMGPYGTGWGFKKVTLDYSLIEKGLIVFTGVFFYSTEDLRQAEFPIINSISIYKDNAHTKLDDDFAKKVETDALTKALSKIGFSADVFMGLYDDARYVQQLEQEIKQKAAYKPSQAATESAKMLAVAFGNNDVDSMRSELANIKETDKSAVWNGLTEEMKTWIMENK